MSLLSLADPAALKGPDWPALLDAAALDQWAAQGYWVLDDLLPQPSLAALQAHGASLALQPARLTGAQLQQTIRSDRIHWLEADAGISGAYLDWLMALAQWLNRQFFLGIQRVEAHFAEYAPGAFYALHRDNPAGRRERAVSGVFYLNGHWQPQDGGQIRLQDLQGQWHEWLPLANRLVLFDSDLLHEVLPATRPRQSIASWLRRDALPVHLV